VTDFKLGKVDVELGIGYGLMPESDGWSPKPSLGTPSQFREKATKTRRRQYR